ncbi:uncharacterized protein LOC133533409 [Cydia pomonella]|uniref:uncharacterized protein LOC133524507 n=1 Tax=Cydia pomonella TaxID=82600 RepID=UPI002ADE56D0|nr:uncharacterized protein LOC133524507 [Cydia pomonella]XP_061728365.1 uncharacterized protein LOC133533409 [Cydia pomonella]
MPKRTIDERISEYHKKIEQLQRKKNKEPSYKRIRVIQSSSDEDNEQDTNIVVHRPLTDRMNREGTEPFQPEGQQCTQQLPINDLEVNPRQNTESEHEIAEPEVEQSAPMADETTQASAEIPVEPELLMALGESTDDIPEFGKPIHDSLASLWLPVLKKGLLKENKEKLLKSYLIPENCKLLQSPKLNAEISAAVSEIVRGRDKKLSGFQQQLGAGVTAINKGMEILLNNGNKAQALTHFSDSCRILTDLHCASTKDRIKLLTPSLEKNILHVIQDSERDDTLFGNALSEKIKASKAIQRQGQQIKKTYQPSTSGFRQSTVYRYTPPGNWRGPPRYSYPNSRGGRGSQTRMTTPRRSYNYSTTPPAAKPVPQTRPRAPTQQ